LVLVYDSGDTEARAIADRVSVNLRELGLAVQVSEQAMNGKAKAPAADLRLARRRIDPPVATSALSGLLKSYGEGAPDMKTLEDAYDAERSPVESYHVIPLVHVSESYGLSSEVRDWMTPRWGGWDLADVWLGPPSASSGSASGSSAP
jgi:hypothetical protein